MGKRVLIAEPREVIRTGLCIVFQKDTSVSEVKSVNTREELKKHLSSFDVDLAIINQSLAPDLKALPAGKFALLIDEPDLDGLLCAYEHQALGYFSIRINADMLRATLKSPRDTFFVDPVLLPWIMELIAETKQRTENLQLLSSREREVVLLLDEGLDRRTIARQLHIAEATLKTHIKNIARKQEDIRWSEKVLDRRSAGWI